MSPPRATVAAEDASSKLSTSAGSARLTELAAGRDANLRQVRGEPLLQTVRGTRGEQGRPRHPAAELDQQRGAVDVGPGTGERRRRAARALGIAHRADQDDLRVRRLDQSAHRAGLTAALLVTAR